MRMILCVLCDLLFKLLQPWTLLGKPLNLTFTKHFAIRGLHHTAFHQIGFPPFSPSTQCIPHAMPQNAPECPILTPLSKPTSAIHPHRFPLFPVSSHFPPSQSGCPDAAPSSRTMIPSAVGARRMIFCAYAASASVS